MYIIYVEQSRGRRGSDHVAVASTTTYAISVYHHYRCSGFLRVLRFPPLIKLTATI